MEREFEPRQFGSGTYMLKSPLMIIMIKTNIDCMFSITICQTPWWVFYKYSVLYSQPYYMVSGVPTEQMEKWGKWCWVTQVSCCPDPSISSTEPMFLTQQKGHGKIETNNHGTQTWGSMEEAESRVKDDADSDIVLTLNSVFDGFQGSAGKGGCETKS